MRIFRTMNAVCAMAGLAALAAGAPAQESTITFSGRDWTLRDGGPGGPGPNDWSRSCAWVDKNGWLHLKISHRDGKWQCAEVETKERLGFGRYQFQIAGRIDKLDPQVVLGLFPYPTRDVGPDGTNEIDIEFARWAIPTAPNGNFTVWPPKKGRKQGASTYEFALTGPESTHRFIWSERGVLFQSLNGRRNDDQSEIKHFDFRPPDFHDSIPQQPMPLHINLWLFRGKPPTDGKEVEIVVKSATFTP